MIFSPASAEMCTFILTKHENAFRFRRNFIYFWCQKQQYQRYAFNIKKDAAKCPQYTNLKKKIQF